MKVKCISSHPDSDPLISSSIIPPEFDKYLVPNAERTVYKTKNYHYLEQIYTSRDCVISFLDFIVHKSCYTQPIADVPMLVLLYMLIGSVRGKLAGLGKVPLKQGNSYFLYLPAEAVHRAYLRKGHMRFVYCSFSKEYIDMMASEEKGIADMLDYFNNGDPKSLIEKPAIISFNALYQMWQVKSCTKSQAFCEGLLMARGRDLALDYVLEANERHQPVKKFVTEVLQVSDGIFKAKEIIDQNAAKYKIKEIAAQVGLSEQKLKRGFKAAFQKPIITYQTEIILARVCKLLLTTDTPIKEIAYDVGYSEVSSLTRMFKREMEVNPKKYRDQAKSRAE